MANQQVYIIGRSDTADITLKFKTVSASHAELVATTDGKYYLTDRNSTHGTKVLKDGQWKSIRQSYVDADQLIMFADHETTVTNLMRSIEGQSSREQGSESKLRRGSNSTIRQRDMLPSGFVERNSGGRVVKR